MRPVALLKQQAGISRANAQHLSQHGPLQAWLRPACPGRLLQPLGVMKPILLALLTCVSCVALAAEQQRPVTSISQIPAPVVRALIALCAPCAFADVGAPWEATDVISDNLPQRRLTRVEHIGAEWHIEYEHGGRGKHSHNVIFSTVGDVHFVGGSCNSASRQKCEW